MWGHPSRRLAAYCDGQMSRADAQRIDAHLATCERCRRACDDIRFAASAVRRLTLASPPASVWQAIDEHLRQPAPRRLPALRWQYAMAATLLVLVTAAAYWQTRSAANRVWEVAVREAGQAERSAKKAAGDWVETTPASRARIVVGSIGTVEVEPNARVQLGVGSGSQFRLALERGTISATITAPPRMFIVDTPSSTVVDLGCAYTVTVAPDGATELHMTTGWAALEWNNTETLVPAGAMSRTRKGQRPGLPYFEDAPPDVQQAVAAIEATGVSDTALTRILNAARVRDTLTLWHLLAWTDGDGRVRVYDRMHELVAPPAGVEGAAVLRLDPDALKKYREELAWHW